jgi:hypothetical protein
MEFDFAFGGFGLEIGGHRAYLKSHFVSSCASSCRVILGAKYKGRKRLSEWRPRKGEILLSNREPLASSFAPPVRQKSHSGGKCSLCPAIAFNRPQHAGSGSDTELSRTSQRQIGNHLKNQRSEFRIVNYSFTPA